MKIDLDCVASPRNLVIGRIVETGRGGAWLEPQLVERVESATPVSIAHEEVDVARGPCARMTIERLLVREPLEYGGLDACGREGFDAFLGDAREREVPGHRQHVIPPARLREQRRQERATTDRQQRSEPVAARYDEPEGVAFEVGGASAIL